MAAMPLADARLAAAGLLFLALASVAAAGLFFGTAAGLLLLAIASVVAEGFLFGATAAPHAREKRTAAASYSRYGGQTVLYIRPPSEAKQDSYITMIDEEITVTDVQPICSNWKGPHSSHTSLYNYINTQT